MNNNHSANQPQYVDVNNTRENDQLQLMKKIEKAKHCPFCQPQLATYHKLPILFTTKYWLVTTNQWPYPYTKRHFLIITQEHYTQLSQIPSQAGEELVTIIQKLERDYQIAGGGLAMRFGNTKYSAGSVNHLHAQLIEPDIKHPNFEPVRVKIGTKQI